MKDPGDKLLKSVIIVNVAAILSSGIITYVFDLFTGLIAFPILLIFYTFLYARKIS